MPLMIRCRSGNGADALFNVNEAVMNAENFFLSDVAVEVEAVKAEALRLAHLALGKFRCGPEAVHAPVAPGDGREQFDAPAVEAKDGVGAEAVGREPTETEGAIADLTRAVRTGHGDAQPVEMGRGQVPEMSVGAMQAGASNL